MKYIRIKLCTAFLVASSSVYAQDSNGESEASDVFAEAVDDHFDNEIKTRIRQNITQKVVDAIGNKRLSDLTRKIPGIVYKNTPVGRYTNLFLDTTKLAFTVKPAGEGSDMSLDGLKNITIQNVINSECEGRGNIDQRSIHTSDLDIDGNLDFIVDSSGISCAQDAGNILPLSCGAQICSSYFFLYRDRGYTKVWEQLAYIEDVTDNTPPNIVMYLHGGNSTRVSWDGQTFSDR